MNSNRYSFRKTRINEFNNEFGILKIEPQITLTKFTSILNKTKLYSIKHVSSFAKIARGQRKKYLNCQLIPIEINVDLIELE